MNASVPRVAWPVIYGDPAQVFVASDEYVLTRLDAYPDEELWTAEAVDEEVVSFQIRLSAIFDDPPAGG